MCIVEKQLYRKFSSVLTLFFRTDNAVKNHWNSTIKRKVETGYYAGVDTTLHIIQQTENEEMVPEETSQHQVFAATCLMS